MLPVLLAFAALLLIAVPFQSRHLKGRILVLHPNFDAGGGGEKCLWALVNALGKRQKDIVLFGRKGSKQLRIQDAEAQFHAEIRCTAASSPRRPDGQAKLTIWPLMTAGLLTFKYPVATSLLQMLSGPIVALEMLIRIWILCVRGIQSSPVDERGNAMLLDTTGLPQVMLFIHIFSVVSRAPIDTKGYIHWPLISKSELPAYSPLGQKRPARVSHQLSGIVRIAYRKLTRSFFKWGRFAYCSPIVVNSTFTWRGLHDAWGREDVRVLYPPVMKRAAIPREGKSPLVLSIAQFRPEKNHRQQIEAIALLLTTHELSEPTRFLLAGSCRPGSDDDLILLRKLLDYSDSLIPSHLASITLTSYGQSLNWHSAKTRTTALHSVEFHTNVPGVVLSSFIALARVGFHTMVDEHFGITVVDLLLAGAFVVAHDSAGPRDDILCKEPPLPKEIYIYKGSGMQKSRTILGCLCKSVEEYAAALKEGLDGSSRVNEILSEAKAFASQRFPDFEDFGKALVACWEAV